MAVQIAGDSERDRSASVSILLLRLLLLFAIDALAFWFVFNLVADGVLALALAVILIVAFANFVLLYRDAYPLRWMLIGLVLMAMFAIYPIIFTVFVAFTNYGDGHLFTKTQSIEQIEKQRVVIEGGTSYSWTGYVTEEGTYALWITDADGNAFFAVPGEPLVPSVDVAEAADRDDAGIPNTVGAYRRLNRIQVAANPEIQQIQFGTEEEGVQIRTPSEAAALEPLFVYDAERDVLVRQTDNVVFEPTVGRWTSAAGAELQQGFRDSVGLENFRKFFASPALRGPLARIVIWNFSFALLSVLSTFALGLGIAYIFNDPEFPGRKLIQSFLLIPYTIPSLITILIWRGMFNPDVGVVNRYLSGFGLSPEWFTDPWLAKGAILFVNLWLGYPYFMLICSGALQAIPKDIYAAAEVDGANAWQRFWTITLPLLLVAVGPLLVASFTFNFNNFNIIFLFIQGGPPIANSPTPAGHTDILISYVYNLAFSGGQGKEYGFASAITIVIFVIVAVITLFQFRYTKMWEEVGESV